MDILKFTIIGQCIIPLNYILVGLVTLMQNRL
jgi:hypothetical protein